MPKQDLVFRKPYLNTAGSLGFAPDVHSAWDWGSFGAFVTNPISLRRRGPTQAPALVEYPGGILIHTGLPNPGLRTILGTCARNWRLAPLPIIVHVMADRPEETRAIVTALEGQENILAFELGFAPMLADDIILLAIEKTAGEVPIIVSLPAEEVLRLGPRAEARGATAISICAPRGTLAHGGGLVSGRLFGPGLFPQALDLVRSACRLGLTMIASGGVTSKPEADAMLAAGATAVQFDIGLWLPCAKTKSPVN